MDRRPKRQWDGRPTPEFKAPPKPHWCASYTYQAEPHIYHEIKMEHPANLIRAIRSLPIYVIVKRIWDERPGDDATILSAIARREAAWKRLARDHRLSRSNANAT
jgi:hypothetical protein